MKKLILVAMAAIGAAFCSFGAVSLNGTTLTISGENGLLNAVLSGEYAAYYTAIKDNDGTVTAVIVEGSSALTMSEDLDYTGSWTFTSGTITLGDKGVTDPTSPLGKGTGSSATITINSTSSQVKIAQYCSNAVIDAPIHVTGNGVNSPIYLAGSSANLTQVRFNGHILVELAESWCSCSLFLGGSNTKIYMYGGMTAEAHTVTTTGANGSWYVYDNPVTLKGVKGNWTSLCLYAAGNAIGTLNFASQGFKVFLYSEGALSGCAPVVTNLADSNSYISLRADGDFAFQVGAGNTSTANGFTASTGLNPALVLTNDTDVTFSLPVTAGIAVKKQGEGKMTFTGTLASTKSLTVEGGTAAFADGAKWSGCSGITLAGGKVEVAASGIFPSSMDVTVADKTKVDQILLPTGTMTVRGFYLGSQIQDPDTYGSSTSSALVKMDLFDAGSTGVLAPTAGGIPVTVSVASGETKTISEALSASDLAKLNNNEYTIFNKSGAGTLVLDQALTYTGSWKINAGVVRVTAAENAFGAVGDYAKVITVNHAAGASVSFAANDIVVVRPIMVIANTSASLYPAALELGSNKGSLTLNGKLTCSTGQLTLMLRAGTTFYTKGGVEALDAGVVNEGANSHWWVQGEPARISKVNLRAESLHFDVAGNEIGTFVFNAYSYVLVEKDAAFIGRPKVQFVCKDASIAAGQRGYIDMKGHDVAVDFDAVSSYGYGIENTGDAATLDLGTTQNVTTNYASGFTGKTSIMKGGEGTVVFATNVLAVGSLTVTNGVFALRADAKWANCTNICVSGEGAAAEIAASEPFARRADVALAEGGKLILTDGAVQTAGYLYVDGRMECGGTWGSSASSAQHKDDIHFAGTGILDVKKNRGMAIILR